MIEFFHRTHQLLNPVATGLGWFMIGIIVAAIVIVVACFIVDIVMSDN